MKSALALQSPECVCKLPACAFALCSIVELLAPLPFRHFYSGSRAASRALSRSPNLASARSGSRKVQCKKRKPVARLARQSPPQAVGTGPFPLADWLSHRAAAVSRLETGRATLDFGASSAVFLFWLRLSLAAVEIYSYATVVWTAIGCGSEPHRVSCAGRLPGDPCARGDRRDVDAAHAAGCARTRACPDPAKVRNVRAARLLANLAYSGLVGLLLGSGRGDQRPSGTFFRTDQTFWVCRALPSSDGGKLRCRGIARAGACYRRKTNRLDYIAVC